MNMVRFYERTGWMVGILVALLVPVITDAAVLSIFPERESATVGESVRLEVGINTEGERVNTVQALVLLSPELSVVGVETGGSLIDLWIEKPTYNEGMVRFTGGFARGFAGRGLIGSIIVKPTSVGEAVATFDQSSLALLHDGAGTSVTLVREGAAFPVEEPLPLAVRSPTHPVDSWGAAQTAVVEWTPSEGAIYSWSFDTNPETVPDTIPESATPPIEIQGLGDGLHYFHLREGVPNRIDGYEWSGSTHLRLLVDTTAPRAYESWRVDAKNVLVPARDESAGIASVSYRWQAAWFPPGGRWHTVEPARPVPVPTLLRWFGGNLITRATDGAGNAREQTLLISGNTTAKVLGTLILIAAVAAILRAVLRIFHKRIRS